MLELKNLSKLSIYFTQDSNKLTGTFNLLPQELVTQISYFLEFIQLFITQKPPKKQIQNRLKNTTYFPHKDWFEAKVLEL